MLEAVDGGAFGADLAVRRAQHELFDQGALGFIIGLRIQRRFGHWLRLQGRDRRVQGHARTVRPKTAAGGAERFHSIGRTGILRPSGA